MGSERNYRPSFPGDYLADESMEKLRRLKELDEKKPAPFVSVEKKIPNRPGRAVLKSEGAEISFDNRGISARPTEKLSPSVGEAIVFPAAGPVEAEPEAAGPEPLINREKVGPPAEIGFGKNKVELPLNTILPTEESREEYRNKIRAGDEYKNLLEQYYDSNENVDEESLAQAVAETDEDTRRTRAALVLLDDIRQGRLKPPEVYKPVSDAGVPKIEKPTRTKEKKGKKVKVQAVDASEPTTVATPEPLPAPPSPEPIRKEKQDRKGFDGSPEFEFFSQLYIQGMEPEEMAARLRAGDSQSPERKLDLLAERFTDVAAVRSKFTPKDWDAALDSFCKLVKEGRNNPDGFDPAARMMVNITRTREGLTYDQLNAATRAEAAEKFTKATQELWKDFYYSGRWKHNDQRGYYVSEETDLDAKVSLFLAKKAGILDVLNKKAQPLAASEHVPGATTLDSGWVQGVKLEEHPDGTTTLRIDNHPEGRTLVESATAKMLYRMLSATEMVDKNDNALKVLVELSVADDNAHLVNNKREFSQSDRTLRGLHKYFNDFQPRRGGGKIVTGADRLYTFMRDAWRESAPNAGVDLAAPNVSEADKKKAWWKVYTSILDKQLNPGEIKKYSLDYGKRKQRENIDRAWEILGGKTETLEGKESLIKQGRLIKTPDGKYYLVDIVDMNEKYKGFKGGHEAIQAFGLDGRIAFDKQENSFLVNTMRRATDLSKIWKLPQGVPVRGAMVIKPKNGVPLKFGLKEILDVMAPGYAENPKGIIKDYLENGPPPSAVVSEKSAGRKLEDTVSQIPIEGTENVPLGAAAAVVERATADQPVPPPAEALESQTLSPERDEEIEKQVEKIESFTDVTGIEFKRALTSEEEKIKDEIDVQVRQRLGDKAKKLPEYAASSDKEQFVDNFVERGVRYDKIIMSRIKLYREKNLPVSEKYL